MPPGSLQGAVLNVEDLRATHTELSERGIEFYGAPEDESGGSHAFFKDPDGNDLVGRGQD
jgi:hypothetical protein